MQHQIQMAISPRIHDAATIHLLCHQFLNVKILKQLIGFMIQELLTLEMHCLKKFVFIKISQNQHE
jgi:hypothetical protein